MYDCPIFQSMGVSATGRRTGLAANLVVPELKRELANVTTPRPHTAEPTVSAQLLNPRLVKSGSALVGIAIISVLYYKWIGLRVYFFV